MNAEDAQKLRDIVNKVLKDGDGGISLNRWNDPPENPNVQAQAGGVAQKVEQLAKSARIVTEPVDASFWPVVIEHLWTLARIGAIALMPQDPPIGGGGLPQGQRRLPSFVVTELGRKLFSEPDYSPQDWAKYKVATLLRVTTPDDVVLAYLHEAVLARQGALYRASLVMLGCASEKLILLLADAVRDASIAPQSENIRRLQKRATPPNIKDVFEQVRNALTQGGAKLPPKLDDAIDLTLSPIFNRARGLRNTHGHPTGAPVNAEDADEGLKLFPNFYAFVDAVIQHLRTTFPTVPTGPT